MRSQDAGVVILICMAVLSLCGCTSKAELLSDASAGTLIVEETKVFDTSEDSGDAVSEEKAPEDIYVHVCGAVRNPGLYRLPPGSRVSFAVDAAGGFEEDADREYINLAAVLLDGVKIDVPTVEESSALMKTGASPDPVAGVSAVPGDPSQASGSGGQSLVNLNTADETELQSISGIGPSKARAVVRYREEHGPFSDISEIMNVSGIGSSTYERIKDQITV